MAWRWNRRAECTSLTERTIVCRFLLLRGSLLSSGGLLGLVERMAGGWDRPGWFMGRTAVSGRRTRRTARGGRPGGKVLVSYGRWGDREGEFPMAHDLAIPLAGDVDVGEIKGRRVRKMLWSETGRKRVYQERARMLAPARWGNSVLI